MPFVLFALFFPLYFMLVTSLKKNAELYDVNSVPFLIKRGGDARALPVALRRTRLFLELVREQPDRQPSRRR